MQVNVVQPAGLKGEVKAIHYLTMDYILDRKAFGRPIGAFQNSRFKMAEMRTALDATQTFIDQLVILHNDGELETDCCRSPLAGDRC